MSEDNTFLSDSSIETFDNPSSVEIIEESERTKRYIQRILNKTKTMSSTSPSTGCSASAQTKREEFILDPFSANINPGTESGRKLFLKATEERSESTKMDVKQGNAKEFLDIMTDDAKNFSWGVLVHRLTDSDGVIRSILRDVKKVTLNGVKLQAMKIWHDHSATHQSTLPPTFTTTGIDPANVDTDKPIFYARTRSTMIAKRVLGSISTATKKTLFTKKKDFAWLDGTTGEYNYDGPTILYILMATVNLNTRVGVTGLKEKIRLAKMASFNHNVKDLLTDIATSFNLIIDDGFTHDDIVMDTFNALLTSKNTEFNVYIQRHKDAWEEGKTFTLDGISADAINKYNNLVHQKIWNKADPKDAKLLALTTEVQDLKSQIKSSEYEGASGTSKCKGNFQLEAWRMKKDVAKKVVDGVQYWWCPHHKREGVFDGLYMPHDPNKGHEEWQRRKNERKAKKDKKTNTNSGTSSSATSGSSQSLQLNDSMKRVLMTRFGCSENAASKVFFGAL